MRTRVKASLATALTLAVIISMTGCGGSGATSSSASPTPIGTTTPSAAPSSAPSTSSSPPTSSVVASSAPESSASSTATDGLDQINGIEIPPDYTGAHRVFDFNEFQTDKLIYGEHSIDQLAQKFGAPTKIYGYEAEIVGACVTVEYPGVTASMYPLDGELSFAAGMTGEPDTEYPLADQDKTLQMNVFDQTVTDPAFPLSRGLKIGTSTHDDVLAAYPSGSPSDDGSTYTVFNYVWFNDYARVLDGSVAVAGLIYLYDSTGILLNVSFGWTVID